MGFWVRRGAQEREIALSMGFGNGAVIHDPWWDWGDRGVNGEKSESSDAAVKNE